jgi:hypothetical protein
VCFPAELSSHFALRSYDQEQPHEKIGSRPVFHYRLPQAQLSDPTWSIMPDWERWLSVERLAMNLDQLAAGGKAALSQHLP